MKSILNKLDHDRIVEAIGEAEKKTSGQIRVHLHHRRTSDPIASAREVFDKLGMANTSEKNGALVFVAPKSKNFAILGDSGIHEKCGEDFWKDAASKLSGHFREGKFADGLIATVNALGEELAHYFPARPDTRNELPDEVDES
jgi:uncharacterized membrane protein